MNEKCNVKVNSEELIVVPQNVWRYRRGDVWTDVVITGEYNISVNSEELIVVPHNVWRYKRGVA